MLWHLIWTNSDFCNAFLFSVGSNWSIQIHIYVHFIVEVYGIHIQRETEQVFHENTLNFNI